MEKKDNVRSAFRVPLTNVIGEYVHKGIVDTCEVIDISFYGAAIKVNQIIAENDIVDVRFELGKYGRIFFKAKVASNRGGKVGLSFIEIPEKSKKSIARFIEEFTNNNISKILQSKNI